MGETPFLLVYDVEALILVVIGESTIRYSRANKKANNEALLIKLDLLEEHQNLTYVRMVAQKQRMERYHNRKANLRYFHVGDLALRKATQSNQEINVEKLRPTRERPYQISSITSKGLYQLENQDEVKLPSNCNMTHCKRHYY
ncbi:uncharacterized protein [Nicotiana tomentosiformis]|uniref:uncharacterized protein n=1 Tax=Nicotiana tomentosiformis TaxID=4098 RepID=UPI00388CA438